MKAIALDREALNRLIEDRRSDYVTALGKLVECPSVSTLTKHKDDCRQAGRIACELIQRAGGKAELIETDGNPVILGRLESSSSAPTVSIYNHIDVQPATEGADGWTRQPFVFSEEGDRFYGRGATDDKGPAISALFGAQLAREQGIDVNVHFLWELEEEIGSPHFEQFLERTRDRLDTDFVVVSDTLWLAPGKPAVPYGLRGLCAAQLVLETAEKDAHSGVTGGAARNPIAELCQVISQCHDARTGEITIEGFSDTWKPASKDELDDFVASGFDRDSFLESQALKSLRTDDVREITERIWTRPTFEVHGMVGGYQDEGVKTVVPPRAEAKISFRLVPPQEPEQILDLLRKQVAKLNPDVRVLAGHGIRGYLGDRRGPLAEATADALDFGFNARPAFIREGGSIGAVLLMDEHLEAPITLMGLSLPEHSYHGPNEYFDWGQASGGMAAFAYLLGRLAAERS
jgi:acetylornithine deacetylase/succinyl-diaminopimelate desuccinylase-like protein